MYGTLRVQDYKRDRSVQFECNASHVHVYLVDDKLKRERCIFKRTTDPAVDAKWYDAKHQRLLKAMDALEKAIREIEDEGA